MSPSTQRPIALITGANQGIGRAVAWKLAKEHSYHVLIGARRIDAGEAVADEIRKSGFEATAIKLDLDSRTSIDEAVKKLEQDFGYLDVLINNAGIIKDLDPTYETWDLFTQTFTTNVIGPATLTEKMLPLLRRAKASPSRIVFVSTTMGSLEKSTDKTTNYYNTDFKSYDASKAAVNMLMLNYARILDGTAKVNAACPGLIKTALTGFMENAEPPELGAVRITELATLGEDGPTGTFSDRHGPIPW